MTYTYLWKKGHFCEFEDWLDVHIETLSPSTREADVLSWERLKWAVFSV